MSKANRELPGVVPVSVIILTHNEEVNIRDCLASLRDFAEVIVVDSGSTDQTLQIVREEFAFVRIFNHPFKDFGDQRNWAIDNSRAKYDWILFLDADERCTSDLAAEIQQTIDEKRPEVGYYLTYRNFFLGRWIKRSTLYPTWQLRLLKKDAVRFRKEGHGQCEVTDGPLGYLDAPYDHFGFSKGLHDWIARHNDYSSNEVELLLRLRGESLSLHHLFVGPIERRRAVKRIASRLGLMRPLTRFFYLFFVRMAILDGRPGLYFCLLRLADDLQTTVKMYERIATSYEQDV